MIQVMIRITAPPRRTVELVKTLRSLMLPLGACPGFVSSQIYSEPDHPERLCYVEEWRTAEELDQQIQSSHYTRLLAIMEESAEPPELRLSWITEAKGLEYLEKIRLGHQCDPAQGGDRDPIEPGGRP